MAADPRFAPGQVIDGRLICGAKNKKGEPCGLGPVPGATRCGRHGGKAPQVKAAAERRLAEQKAKDIMTNAVRTLGLPVDIDPGKALLDEIHWTAGHVAWLREKVQELESEDLVWGKAASAPSDMPRDPDAVIGLAARRPLRAGAAVLAHDVSAPQVIKAGEVITVIYQAEGISLSLQGKALGNAGVGEMLNVENTASKKTIQAVVTGPGEAIVGPAAEELKAARSTRFAAR